MSKQRWFWYLLASLALAAAGGLYLQPDFMVQMANQVWACF